jgi:outer membrane protein OmpA-like peptidoglycan-associated protein
MIPLNTVGRIFVGSFRQRCSILLVPIILLLGARAFAQSPTDPQLSNVPEEDSSFRHVRFGASVGLNLGHYTTSTFVSSCSEFTNADAQKFALVAFSETRLIPDPSIWLSFRLRSIDYSARFANGVEEFPIDKIESGKRVSILGFKQQFFNVTLHGIGISPGVKWEPVPGFSVGFDPSFILLLAGAPTQTEEILNPSDAFFPLNGERSRSLIATPPQFASVAFDLGATAGILFPLSRNLSLSFEAHGSILLSSLVRDMDWKGTNLLLTAGFAYGAAPVVRAKDTMRPPIIPPLPPQKPSVLSATIIARGIDENGQLYDDPEIEIEEAPWTESAPVIPFVFFERESAELPSRYVRLRNSTQVERYSVDSILYVTPMDIHWQTLNIIGTRLREHPDVTMTIRGRTSGEEIDSVQLAMDRATAVREYLISVWNIDPERITISDTGTIPPASELTEDGRQENRRVELGFSSDVITHPVTVERVARIASPPSIGFYPEIVTDTLIAEWTITIFQGDKELLRFEGSNEKESLRQSRMWVLSDTRVNRDLTKIGYRLDVRDTTGATTSAEGSFHVKERVTRVDDSLNRRLQLQEFAIVGFNYDSPDMLERHRHEMVDVARSITRDAQVRITGYTDRVGELEHNRQLALNRAQVVRQNLLEILRAENRPIPDDITVQGFGGEAEPFDNNLPEGRILSRMVKVMISRVHGK